MTFLSKLFPSKADQEANAAAASQNQPQVPGAANQQGQQTTNQQPTAPVQQPDPLDQLWHIDPNDPAQANKAQPLDFNIDPAKLAEISGKIDYSQVITPEIRQKIAAGGEEASTAMIEALNAVQRLGYQQNAIATTKLIEAAVRNTEATINDKIDQRLKLGGLNDALASSHPALNNPRYAPITESIKSQIITKFPDATQSEINTMTVKYLENMAADLNPELVKKANTNTQVGLGNLNNIQPETDWLAWLNS